MNIADKIIELAGEDLLVVTTVVPSSATKYHDPSKPEALALRIEVVNMAGDCFEAHVPLRGNFTWNLRSVQQSLAGDIKAAARYREAKYKAEAGIAEQQSMLRDQSRVTAIVDRK